jgi:cytochrome c553
MKRILKWLGIAVAGLVVLLLIALAVIYLASQRAINKTYDVPLTSITVPTDSASIAEGKRLATLRGCFGGCHGQRSEGRVLAELPEGSRLAAPNLTRIVPEYSDAELERAIRHGVRPDGTSLWGMPSEVFYHLSDSDLGVIIAFIRSEPKESNEPPRTRLGPFARFFILWSEVPFAAAELVDHAAPRLNPSLDDPQSRGEYLAKTLCSECHGVDLRGKEKTPGLAIAATYSLEDFSRLMRTGVAMGDRELRLMSDVARSRFVHLTDTEITALHAYLKTLGSQRGTTP